jgi:hypothetical protein
MMLHLYVLYACLHLSGGKAAPPAGTTQCTERQVFFRAEECKGKLPKGGGLTAHSRHARSWLECRETAGDSWIPAQADDRDSRLYEAQAGASDESALAALLAPLSTQARSALRSGDFKHPFQRAFQGPGRLSFFLVGTGSRVLVFAVTNLDDFQFAQMAADVSSSSDPMTTEKDLDFDTIAEDAGVTLSRHVEPSQRAMPPPGGIVTAPR